MKTAKTPPATKKKAGKVEIERGWWWRRLVFSEFHEEDFTTSRLKTPVNGCDYLSFEFGHWEDEIEIAAWRYEMVRRINPNQQLPLWIASKMATHHTTEAHTERPYGLPEWIELPMALHSVLLPATGEDQREFLCVRSYPIKTEPEWSKPMLPYQWRLDADDNALTERFLMLINDARRHNGLPDSLELKARSLAMMAQKDAKRKSHNKGNRNRKVSWRLPELIDTHRSKGGAWGESDRSAVSKAKKEAMEWEPKFLDALEVLKESPFVFPPEAWKPDVGGLTRWLRENFEKWYPSGAGFSL